MIIKITKSEDGAILRFFLKEVLGLSSHTVARLKGKENGILLNGERVTVRAVLTAGDTLSLAVEDERSNGTLLARPIPVRLLYEDEAFLVAEKPSGMPTHPSHGHFEDTLANALAYRYRDVPFVFRAITRLDRETSGAVLVARNPVSAHRLSLAMRRGEIGKSYFALVHGKTPPRGTHYIPHSATGGERHSARSASRGGCCRNALQNDCRGGVIFPRRRLSRNGTHAPDPSAFCVHRASASRRLPVWQGG